jgi:hypothetical protein
VAHSGPHSSASATTSGGSTGWSTNSNAGNEDEWAIGTLPVNVTSTPLSITGLPSMRMQKAMQEEHQRRMRLAVGIAVGVVSLLLMLILYLLIR